MKKLIIVSMITVLTMILLVSCETDYNGSEPENQLVTLGFYQTTDTISNQTTRVSWYANDPDGYQLRFKYLVSSNLDLDNTTCLDLDMLSDDEAWLETDIQYADVSFPFIGDSSYFHTTSLDTNYIYAIDTTVVPFDTTYHDTTIVFSIERLDSKFFLYALDEDNDSTTVISKSFTRENRKPDSPMLKSDKLDIQDISSNYFLIEEPILVLDAPTSNWSEIDFRWQGRDPDGQEVDLEFRWELYAEIVVATDTTDTLLASSNGWSGNYLSISFSEVIKNYADNASELINKYKFVTKVRDDALQESEEPTKVDFFAFVPVFNKSILVIDDTSDDEYDPEKREGSPDGAVVDAMYERLLNESGYQIDLGDDPFDFDVWNVATKGADLPLLKDLTNYKLVIIHSEDRTKDDGVLFPSYEATMTQYLDVGGKMFLIGNSNLIDGTLVDNYYNLPLKKQVYADYQTESLYYQYLGLFSYTEGESFQRNPEWDELDYSNYDFIGVDVFDHTLDTLYAMRLDTAVVNDYWFYMKENSSNPDTLKRDFRLKENGSVFTGINTLQGALGEVIMKYKSVYDCVELDESTFIEDSLAGDLYHNLEHNVDLPNHVGGKVLHRSGVVATRYISPGDVFRTAIFGFPLIFMNDDENTDGIKPVTENFKTMIRWFDLQGSD